MPVDRAEIEDATTAALALVPRIMAHDHTVWGDDPTEVADRLGWLEAVHRADTPKLRDVVAAARRDGITDVLLVGMGGSSLYPKVLSEIAGAPGTRLTVLDSTDPAAVLAIERRLPWASTLLIVASKSGTTLETIAHLDRFSARLRQEHGADAGRHMLAITDPGSALEARAGTDRFRGVVHGDPDVGGRYSALTAFGLLPAAFLDIDLDEHLRGAADELDACGATQAQSNPAAVLGARMAVAARYGVAELELRLPERIAGFGGWVEQLVAESLGKDGVGVLPLVDGPAGAPSPRRVVVEVGDASTGGSGVVSGHQAGADVVPDVVRMPYDGIADLGRLVVRFEFATAVAGALLGVNPFDQPDVAAAKDATSRVLDEGGELPPSESIAFHLDAVADGEAVVLLGFVQPGGADERALRAAAATIGARTGGPVTVGIGPRYLHSTGQLHKGGPDLGLFAVVVGDDPEDAAIPGRDITFAQLKVAQATGDHAALKAAGRRVVHTSIESLTSL